MYTSEQSHHCNQFRDNGPALIRCRARSDAVEAEDTRACDMRVGPLLPMRRAALAPRGACVVSLVAGYRAADLACFRL
jgi:hypothetical protein